jgi:transposase
MVGYTSMKRKGWRASSLTNRAGTVGGSFAEVEAAQEALVETLRAGPGDAARREMAVGASGPAPSRWTLRTVRASVDWLMDYTLSGVWRVMQSCGLGLHTSCARLFSPDPGYASTVRRLHRCLRDAARPPDTVVALFLDEFGYQRWPEVAPMWGGETIVAPRAGNTQQWRTIGALKALTGQVHYLDGYIVGRQQVSQFYARLNRAYPKKVGLIYVIQGNWNIHTHPDVLSALEEYPRITPVWLPTYAPWLNPMEKLWRWLRQDILKMHRWVEDWPQVKQRVRDFLDQFAHGSAALLRYVGLTGKGKLACVLNTS